MVLELCSTFGKSNKKQLKGFEVHMDHHGSWHVAPTKGDQTFGWLSIQGRYNNPIQGTPYISSKGGSGTAARPWTFFWGLRIALLKQDRLIGNPGSFVCKSHGRPANICQHQKYQMFFLRVEVLEVCLWHFSKHHLLKRDEHVNPHDNSWHGCVF